MYLRTLTVCCCYHFVHVGNGSFDDDCSASSGDSVLSFDFNTESAMVDDAVVNTFDMDTYAPIPLVRSASQSDALSGLCVEQLRELCGMSFNSDTNMVCKLGERVKELSYIVEQQHSELMRLKEEEFNRILGVSYDTMEKAKFFVDAPPPSPRKVSPTARDYIGSVDSNGTPVDNKIPTKSVNCDRVYNPYKK